MGKEKGQSITITDEQVAKSLIKGGHIEASTISFSFFKNMFRDEN